MFLFLWKLAKPSYPYEQSAFVLCLLWDVGYNNLSTYGTWYLVVVVGSLWRDTSLVRESVER
jgi:hypothetical protein